MRRNVLICFLIAILVLPLSVAVLTAQSLSDITLDKIMQGDKWIGHQPGTPFWSADGRNVYFQWNPENNHSDSLYKYNLRNSRIEKVDRQERSELPPPGAVYTKDRNKVAFVRDGDLYIKDLRRSETIQLTNTLQTISSPAFTMDETGLSYVAGNNLYLLDPGSGQVNQLTDFKQGTPTSERTSGKQAQWLENQQLDLFSVLTERKELEELRKKQEEAHKPERPLEIYTGTARVGNIQLSPGERFIAFSLITRPDARQAIIPDFVTTSGYTEDFSTNPKVGSPQMTSSAGIYDLKEKRYYIIGTENVPGIRDVPDFMRDYGYVADELENDRDINFTGIFWSEDGRYAVVNLRAQDNKDRWLMLLDPETGDLTPLDRQRDEAWVAGPGINVWWGSSAMGWMPDNKRIWFQSEASGYSHLYTLDVETGMKKALTEGNFEVHSPQISNDKKSWYFSSNETHPGERHFYRMPLEGGARTRITEAEGRHDVSISPDGKMLAIRYSYFNKPWELFVMENKPGAQMKQVSFSQSGEFREYNWRIPELVTFKAEDGQDVWARLYRPENPVKNGPAVIFVHGAGYLQNVHKWWSSYSREYMFHNLLADMGYTILDIDFRASAGYGRDWRTGIYRHMGGRDLSDNVDGARFLVEEYEVDPSRIGIYGGSYGGFITLMALFNNPDVFAAGAALRSVTDWAHYSHGYTSNILNTPVSDSLAYIRSSPIYFAGGLQGALLMCHGMVDDNVHFQDIVRLTQRLIELGKDNWELAVYPVESHAFTETSSWVDEYRRILKLFEDNLRDNTN
jgi:Tol biopolymer transport system component/dienelactone hydrolase